jgi:hypothetical protein
MVGKMTTSSGDDKVRNVSSRTLCVIEKTKRRREMGREDECAVRVRERRRREERKKGEEERRACVRSRGEGKKKRKGRSRRVRCRVEKKGK